MMRKIYITGAHSVGKTLLWRSLKNELEFENVKIIPFPDTGRIVAAENGYTHSDVEKPEVLKEFIIDATHKYVQLEEDLDKKEANNNTLVIFDRCVLGGLVYTETLFGKLTLEEEILSNPKVAKNFEGLRQQNCLVVIFKPVEKFFEYDGLRPRNMTFSDILQLDEALRRKLDNSRIPYLDITMENLQDRVDLVAKEISKRWPDLKRVPKSSSRAS